MGRIKSLMIKKAAKQLIVADSEGFNDKFEYNKKTLGNNLPSKPIRNKVAGYITRLIIIQKSEKLKLKSVSQPEKISREFTQEV